jgi:probable HAF family extracellular repeat protein
VPGSAATAVSADGAAVVGSCPDGASCSEAWRWTQGTGIVGLGFLSGDATSKVLAVSDDGSVVAGASDDKAARWVEGSEWEPDAARASGFLL